MTDVPRIDVAEARRRVAADEALLVCAYEDAEKCNTRKLDASPQEATAAGQAAKYRARGFNAVALAGGVEAWKQAGYPLALAA